MSSSTGKVNDVEREPAFDRTFRSATPEQRDSLRSFRSLHPAHTVTIEGAKWTYLDGGGEGGTVLILHERASDFAFPLFLRLETEHRCIYPSIPPLGSMVQFVDGLACFLDAIGSTEVTIIGLSFGGEIGQCLVRKRPGLVSKLALVNTSVPNPAVGRSVRRMEVLPKYLPFGAVRFLAKANHRRDFPRAPDQRAFWDAMIEEIASDLSREGIVGYYDAVIDYNLNYKFGKEDLDSWGGEVIILQSDDDRQIKPERQAALRELYPRAKVHMFHDAGRIPYLSQPEEFDRVLKQLLG